MNVSNIKPGDKVVVELGFEHTEHTVENVVDKMVKIKPGHICLGEWADAERIKAAFRPEGSAVPEPSVVKRSFFTSWFN